MYNIVEIITKWVIVCVGAIMGILMPTIPFALLCIFAVFLDSISAWRLAKRIKRNHPEIPDAQIHDKFESEKAWKMFPTLLVIYGVIVLSHLIDIVCFPFLDMYLPNFVAGGFCFYQLWSILENESSENPRSWAKFLQTFMVNKASRHIDGLSETLEDMGLKEKHERFNVEADEDGVDVNP